MCGIAGIVSPDPGEVPERRLRAMTGALAHRGPDGEGFWTSPDGRVGLGHRRLSVIDLSEEGRQPMHFGEDRYTIIYNGEIYNYLELKEELLAAGYRFRSTSDTEVILALYDRKGASCLDDLDGMFSFALYDAREQTLFCARDRFGEKPFYYAYTPGRSFVFGSEMKALWAAGIPRSANGAMLYNYLSFGLLQNVHDRAETFYEGISRLENGHYLILSLKDLSLKKRAYWRLDSVPDEGHMDDARAAETFRDLLHRSVLRRLRSDVRVGSSLSGGLDSTLILHLIRQGLGEGGASIPVFSARFPGFALDEGPYIRAAAGQYGAQTHDCFPDGVDCWAQLDRVFYHQEEPFGSAGIYAQFKVMELAKRSGVTVLLDGQGADELLGGYPHYRPGGIRGLLSRTQPGWIRRLRGGRERARHIWNPLLNKDFHATYVRPNYLPGPAFDYRLNSLNGALHYDLTIGGLQDLLRYSDRNAMAHGREVRLPYLDHELVRFILALPASAKVREGLTKYLMRLAFGDALPAQIVSRTDKIGFEPPQRSWMTEAAGIESIREGAVRLVRNGVLARSYLKRPPEPNDAYRRGKGSWVILMASKLYD